MSIAQFFKRDANKVTAYGFGLGTVTAVATGIGVYMISIPVIAGVMLAAAGGYGFLHKYIEKKGLSNHTNQVAIGVGAGVGLGAIAILACGVSGLLPKMLTPSSAPQLPRLPAPMVQQVPASAAPTFYR